MQVSHSPASLTRRMAEANFLPQDPARALDEACLVRLEAFFAPGRLGASAHARIPDFLEKLAAHLLPHIVLDPLISGGFVRHVLAGWRYADIDCSVAIYAPYPTDFLFAEVEKAFQATLNQMQAQCAYTKRVVDVAGNTLILAVPGLDISFYISGRDPASKLHCTANLDGGRISFRSKHWFTIFGTCQQLLDDLASKTLRMPYVPERTGLFRLVHYVGLGCRIEREEARACLGKFNSAMLSAYHKNHLPGHYEDDKARHLIDFANLLGLVDFYDSTPERQVFLDLALQLWPLEVPWEDFLAQLELKWLLTPASVVEEHAIELPLGICLRRRFALLEDLVCSCPAIDDPSLKTLLRRSPGLAGVVRKRRPELAKQVSLCELELYCESIDLPASIRQLATLMLRLARKEEVTLPELLRALQAASSRLSAHSRAENLVKKALPAYFRELAPCEQASTLTALVQLVYEYDLLSREQTLGSLQRHFAHLIAGQHLSFQQVALWLFWDPLYGELCQDGLQVFLEAELVDSLLAPDDFAYIKKLRSVLSVILQLGSVPFDAQERSQVLLDALHYFASRQKGAVVEKLFSRLHQERNLRPAAALAAFPLLPPQPCLSELTQGRLDYVGVDFCKALAEFWLQVDLSANETAALCDYALVQRFEWTEEVFARFSLSVQMQLWRHVQQGAWPGLLAQAELNESCPEKLAALVEAMDAKLSLMAFFRLLASSSVRPLLLAYQRVPQQSLRLLWAKSVLLLPVVPTRLVQAVATEVLLAPRHFADDEILKIAADCLQMPEMWTLLLARQLVSSLPVSRVQQFCPGSSVEEAYLQLSEKDQSEWLRKDSSKLFRQLSVRVLVSRKELCLNYLLSLPDEQLTVILALLDTYEIQDAIFQSKTLAKRVCASFPTKDGPRGLGVFFKILAASSHFKVDGVDLYRIVDVLSAILEAPDSEFDTALLYNTELLQAVLSECLRSWAPSIRQTAIDTGGVNVFYLLKGFYANQSRRLSSEMCDLGDGIYQWHALPKRGLAGPVLALEVEYLACVNKFLSAFLQILLEPLEGKSVELTDSLKRIVREVLLTALQGSDCPGHFMHEEGRNAFAMLFTWARVFLGDSEGLTYAVTYFLSLTRKTMNAQHELERDGPTDSCQRHWLCLVWDAEAAMRVILGMKQGYGSTGAPDEQMHALIARIFVGHLLSVWQACIEVYQTMPDVAVVAARNIVYAQQCGLLECDPAKVAEDQKTDPNEIMPWIAQVLLSAVAILKMNQAAADRSLT